MPAHQPAEQATLQATSKDTSSPSQNSGPAASDHMHSKGPPQDGTSSHQPTSQNATASVSTGKPDSNAASAGGLSHSVGSDSSDGVQQSSSAAGRGPSVIILAAPPLTTSLAHKPASGTTEPMQPAIDVSHHFPEPQVQPRPTGKTKSAADVHKQSPEKHLAVQQQQQHQRKGEGLLCLVPKTSTVAAADLTSAKVPNQARLEEPSPSGDTTSAPARHQATSASPSSAPHGILAFPFKLHCGRGQPAHLADARTGSSGSIGQSPSSAWQAPAGGHKAQPVAKAAAEPSTVTPTRVDPTGADPTGIDPTGVDSNGVDPNDVDPTGVDPTGVDPDGVDPTIADPTIVDPSSAGPSNVSPAVAPPPRVDHPSADPTKADPSRIDPSGTDHSSVKGKEMTAVPQASQHVAAAAAPAGLDGQAEGRLVNSLAQLLEDSSAAPGPVGKSTGVEQVIP